MLATPSRRGVRSSIDNVCPLAGFDTPLEASGDHAPSFLCPIDRVVGRRGAVILPGQFRARPPVASGRTTYAATFARFRGAMAPPLAPLAALGISWRDPPRPILCAKTARLGGGYPLVSSALAFFSCTPSRLKPPTFGRRAGDRRLPLMCSENREYFGGHRVPIPSIAGEQLKSCRSAGGNPSNRSLRRAPFRRERVRAAQFRAVLVVFPRGYTFATHLRLCGCAGRSIVRIPPRSDLTGASLATRTRRAHAASTTMGGPHHHDSTGG